MICQKMNIYDSGSYKQGDSDGLGKQVMWPVKKWIYMILTAKNQMILME